MEENKIFQNILKRKRSNISHGVLYWTYFKKNILEPENIRKVFSIEITIEEFRGYLEKYARPSKYGMAPCTSRRLGLEARKRNIREMTNICYQYYLQLLSPKSLVYVGKSSCGGLGLFTKKKIKLSKNEFLLDNTIWGLLFEMNEEDFGELNDHRYPSLYEDGKHYILCGPLSLVNHCCDHSLEFTDDQPDKELLAEEFNGIKTLRIKNFFKTVTINKNKEIQVNYDGQFQMQTYFGKKCQCKICCE
jgi:hypothetical protein